MATALGSGAIRRRRAGGSVVRRLGGLARHPARSQLLPLATLTAVSIVATAAAPLLLDVPLLLAGLSPRLPFLVLAADRSPLLVFLVVSTVRLCLADPFHFQLGRRHGRAAADRAFQATCSVAGGWGRRALRWTRAVARRLGPAAVPAAVFVRPSGRNLVLAGAAGTPTRLVAALDIAGTLLYLAAVVGGVSLLT